MTEVVRPCDVAVRLGDRFAYDSESTLYSHTSDKISSFGKHKAMYSPAPSMKSDGKAHHFHRSSSSSARNSTGDQRAAAKHTKLHRRANSGFTYGTIAGPDAPKATTSAASDRRPSFNDAFTFGALLSSRDNEAASAAGSGRIEASPMLSRPPAPAPVPSASSSVLKPYFRRMSLRDFDAAVSLSGGRRKRGAGSHSIDLSRPAAENAALAGLGVVSASAEPNDMAAFGLPPSLAERQGGYVRHGRAASSPSRFPPLYAVTSPSHFPTSPLRPTPRPHTPPSLLHASPRQTVATDIDYPDTARPDADRRASVISSFTSTTVTTNNTGAASLPPPHPSLQLDTASAVSRRLSESSQGPASPGQRSRRGTLLSLETARSATSRNSVDRAITALRGATGGNNTPPDPAAEIRAARQAYREKEDAKERQREKALQKKRKSSPKREGKKSKESDRDSRRQQKKSKGRSRATSLESGGKKSEEVLRQTNGQTPSVVGLPYALAAPAEPPIAEDAVIDGFTGAGGAGAAGAGTNSSRRKSNAGLNSINTAGSTSIKVNRKARGRWLAFVTWLRTRLLRLGKKFGKR